MAAQNEGAGSDGASLRRWQVIEVTFSNGKQSRHLFGHDVTHDECRASSAIKEFNLQTMTAATHSGSTYKLLGVPGHARKCDAIWRKWCRVHEVVSERDVTGEYFSFEV